MPESVPKRRKQEQFNQTDVTSTSYIFTFVLLIVTFLIYDVIFISNVQNEVWSDFEALNTELSTRVHKQDEALSVIFNSVDKLQKNGRGVSVLNFVGSTGVGKTFVANIMKRHFYPSFFESRGSLKTNTLQDILSRVRESTTKYNLIVLDDLTLDEIDNLLRFIIQVPQDASTLVVCIFNIQETDDFLNYTIHYEYVDQIEYEFNKSGIAYGIVKFNELSISEAGDWLIKQLITKGVDVHLHNKIVEAVVGGHNVKYHGLKGLAAKLNLEL